MGQVLFSLIHGCVEFKSFNFFFGTKLDVQKITLDCDKKRKKVVWSYNKHILKCFRLKVGWWYECMNRQWNEQHIYICRWKVFAVHCEGWTEQNKKNITGNILSMMGFLNNFTVYLHFDPFFLFVRKLLYQSLTMRC